MTKIRIAGCNLNQWAMDFDHNRDNIIESIMQAYSKCCVVRTGPELEVCCNIDTIVKKKIKNI